MATDIKGLGTPSAADQAALRSTSKDSSPTGRAPQQQTAAPTVTTKASVDSVNLSSQAQSLKAVEEKIQKLPNVNEKKVAEIKAALASGQYSVDDLVVADKLLGFDELFK